MTARTASESLKKAKGAQAESPAPLKWLMLRSCPLALQVKLRYLLVFQAVAFC